MKTFGMFNKSVNNIKEMQSIVLENHHHFSILILTDSAQQMPRILGYIYNLGDIESMCCIPRYGAFMSVLTTEYAVEYFLTDDYTSGTPLIHSPVGFDSLRLDAACIFN